MYITLEQIMNRLTKQYPVIMLDAFPHVGYATMPKRLERLMAQEGRGRKKVTLDDLTERELAKTDPKMFFQLHRPPLLIDEVQYAPELFPYIKIMVDERHEPGDFWMTGSQIFRMMGDIQESLAGRAVLLHLSPFYPTGYSSVPF